MERHRLRRAEVAVRRRAPLVFRITVVGSRFLRVHVHEERRAMLRALSECHGEKAVHEHAATVHAEMGAPDHGCVADMFFHWRVLRPSIIAHEASHVADVVALAQRVGIGIDSGEYRAQWVERVTEKVWLRTQSAPL